MAVYKNWFHCFYSIRYLIGNIHCKYLIVYSAVTNNNALQQFSTALRKSISNSVVVTFISGMEVLNTNNLPLTLSITNSRSSGNSLNISVNTNFIKIVDISYIVYDSSSLQRSYLVSQGSVGLGSTSVNNSKFFAGTTNLLGYNGFVSPSNNYFDYSCRMNSLLSINVTTKTLTSISLSYIII